MTNFQSTLLRRLAKKGRKANGFTLIELMVVVAIVGVLSSVGLPQLLKAQDRAKISVAQQEAVNYAKECSISLLTGAEAPDGSQYDTIASAQTCEEGVDIIAESDTDPVVTITVEMDGSIPLKPTSSEDTDDGGDGDGDGTGG
jgi:prepilin-type N-terminal cleavage/methylation domain-containing protein